jgi:hypothetical protein
MVGERTAMHFAFARPRRKIAKLDRVAETISHDIALAVHDVPSVQFHNMMRIGCRPYMPTLPKGSAQ